MNRAVSQSGILDVTTNVSSGQRLSPTGFHALQLDAPRDALLYVPPSYTASPPAPLAVMLHGAGGNAQHGLSLLRPIADASNLILLAPCSRKGTWDIIEDQHFGNDVLFISAALQQVFDQYAVELKKVAIGGFSDGASYALSLGLINGDLFTHILAFSPGFYFAPKPKGKPQIYVSHGVDDTVLPIRYCSRRFVPQLKKLHYNVIYREFDGGHVLPPTIRDEAVNWFLHGA